MTDIYAGIVLLSAFSATMFFWQSIARRNYALWHGVGLRLVPP